MSRRFSFNPISSSIFIIFCCNKLGPIGAKSHVTSASSEPVTRRPDNYREPLQQLSRPVESHTLLSTSWRWYTIYLFLSVALLLRLPETAALFQDGEAHQA